MSDFESRLRNALNDETVEVSARATLADDMVRRGTTVRRRRRVAGGVAVAAVVVVAFPIWRSIDTSPGSTGPANQNPTITQNPPTTPHTPTTPPSTTPPATTTHPVQLPAWTGGPVDSIGEKGPQPRVINLRYGSHSTFDRVVIDLDGATEAGYHVDFVKQIVKEGTGEPIPLPGNAFLLVRLTTALAHTDAGQPTYEGQSLEALDLPMLRGYALAGDFEGVSFGLSLRHQTAFRVFTLSQPNRLVIDVRH